MMSFVVNLIILTLVGRVQELVPPLAYLKPVMMAMLLGGFALVVYYPYQSMGQKMSRPTFFWMLASIGFVASVPMGLYQGKSIQFLSLTYLCTVFLFLLVSQCVRRFRTLEQMATTLMVMTFMLGVAIIVIPKRIVTDTGFRSSVSDTYDANDLAVVFAMGIPFVFYTAWRGGFLTKILGIMVTLLAAYGIHLTGSRGGLIALATVFLYMVLRVKEIGSLLRSTLIGVFILGALAATQTSTFQQLILAVNGKDYNTSAEDGRLQVWKRGLGYIATHPIVGVGIVCFEEAEGLLSGRSTTARGIRWTAAHNSYIQVCAEVGIPAFICWILMIGSSFTELRRQRRLLLEWSDDIEVRRMLFYRGMVETSLCAYVVGAFFLSLGYFVYLYLVVAIVVAMSVITNEKVAQLEEEAYEEINDEVDELPEAELASERAAHEYST